MDATSIKTMQDYYYNLLVELRRNGGGNDSNITDYQQV
jgi:hypothetical protein